MSSFFSRLRAAFARPPERRGCAGPGGFFELRALAAPEWPAANPSAFPREGFAGNPVGYRCVSMIAEAVASIPWRAFEGQDAAPDHPALALLRRPNPAQSGPELTGALISHLQISGNGWLKVTLSGGAPAELHVLRPDRVRVVPGEDGWPRAWDYTAGGRTVRLTQGPDDPLPPLMHLRLFSPLSDHYGLSPFAAAARAVDIHNAAASWSKALLDNAARPSGALVYRGEAGAGLSPEQFARLREELAEAYSGARNAGRPMVLEGGLEWTPLAHSPRDMEHIETRHAAARDIALAFGLPPMLLGIPGDNTYSNYSEANRTFWRQTVLPLARRLGESLSAWLAPVYGEGFRLAPAADAVEALSGENEALWARLRKADFLTINEKRQAAGYAPIDDEGADGLRGTGRS